MTLYGWATTKTRSVSGALDPIVVDASDKGTLAAANLRGEKKLFVSAVKCGGLPCMRAAKVAGTVSCNKNANGHMATMLEKILCHTIKGVMPGVIEENETPVEVRHDIERAMKPGGVLR